NNLVGNGHAKGPGQIRIEDVLRAGDLDLQVVIARAERAELVAAAVDGPIADQSGVRPADAAVLLGNLQVFLPAEIVLQAPAGALLGHSAELLRRRLHEACTADAGGHP